MRSSIATKRCAALLVGLALAALPVAASARLIVVSTTIQDAVDRASPGDTIFVPDGIYSGPGGSSGSGYGGPGDSLVTITKDDITLRGSTNAVIDATGYRYGVMVGPDISPGPEGCPPFAVRNFRIQGFTIRNAGHTGLRLAAVDGFSITGGIYLDNDEYGPFPICSRNGVIAHNFAAGHRDAAIYVGDDDGVVVRNNVVTDSVIGIEIENSINCIVRNNVTTGNTAGILVVVLPGLPMPFTENVRIENNVIVDNNRDNDAGGLAGLFLPSGTGILNVGGDNVSIRTNVIRDNDTFGVAIFGNPFGLLLGDPRIEPFVDGNVVRNNVILGNGGDPKPIINVTIGGDIVFSPDVVNPLDGSTLLADPSPEDNCFGLNAFETLGPPGAVLPSCLP